MKTLVLSMISIAATVAAMTACTSESDPVNEVDPIVNAKTPIEFKSSILDLETKAVKTGDQFVAGDKIAIYGYKIEAPIANYIENIFLTNKTFTYSDGFTATDAYWERGARHYFYAYYPVASADATPAEYQLNEATATEYPSVKIVCKEGTGIEQDLLWAEPAPNGIEFTGAASGKITLPFVHKLARVAFVIKLENDKVPASKLTNVSFDVDKTDGELNIITGELEETNGPKTLSTTIAEASITPDGINAGGFSPMVFPGSTISKIKVTINSQELTVNIGTQPKLEAGKITTITITVKASGISMASSLTEWVAGGTEGAGTVE